MQDDASVIAESTCWLLQIDALLAGVAADPTVCVGVVLVGLLGAAAAKDGGGVGGPVQERCDAFRCHPLSLRGWRVLVL